MVFKPGQSGNPKGRKPGPRTAAFRKTPIVLNLLRERNDVDSLDLLSAVVSHPDIELPMRVQAAAMLAPFQHAKCTSRYISKRVELPRPTTIAEATEQIGQISGLAELGYIGLDEAETIIGFRKSFIEGKATTDIEERLVAVENALRERSPIVEVKVDSDLPPLPGTQIEMPKHLTAAAPDTPKGAEPGRGSNPWSPASGGDKSDA